MAKKYIKNFYYRDQKALLAVSKCGYVSHTNLKNFVADSRIKNYCRDGYIIKETVTKPNGEVLEGYKLTKQGRDFVAKEYGFKDHYHAQSLNHDLKLADKYLSLTEQERETWKTETQLRNEFEEKLNQLYKVDYERYNEIREQLEQGKISMTDCSYISEKGIEIAYEIITNSYGQQEIEAKEKFVEIMKLEYEAERR